MWSDFDATLVAVADTTRPILLIGFIVALFGIAALAVVIGRKQVAASQARALSEDTGMAKGATRGGDGTFSSDWLNQAREEQDPTPRQSWSDVILMQTGEVEPVAPAAQSPFSATVDPAPVYETPAAPAYQSAPVHQPPATAATPPPYEPPQAPVYETAPTFAPAPVPEIAAAPAFEPAPPAHPAPAPVAPEGDSPFGFTEGDPAPPVTGYANEYASFFSAPPAPAEPPNIWSLDPNDN